MLKKPKKPDDLNFVNEVLTKRKTNKLM